MNGGAEGQNRTADTVIFSHVLYQLSYLGTEAHAERKQTLNHINSTAIRSTWICLGEDGAYADATRVP